MHLWDSLFWFMSRLLNAGRMPNLSVPLYSYISSLCCLISQQSCLLHPLSLEFCGHDSGTSTDAPADAVAETGLFVGI